jgi:AraC-like DNA-binding protein
VFLTDLSGRTRTAIARSYRLNFGLEVRWISPDGVALSPPRRVAPVYALPVIQRALADALREAVRWGEPYTFFLGPGVISWVVALVDGEELVGGLVGGEVDPEEDPGDPAALTAYLVSAGCSRAEAALFADGLPSWPQRRTPDATEALERVFYEHAGWRPTLLEKNRENAAQQRQIAQEIHTRKLNQRRAYPYDEERMLLSLIRVGDRSAVRRALNKLLAGMFLYSPRTAVVRARGIELLGYLIRAAVEDSPQLEPLIEHNQRWIERVVAADDFESVCAVLRDAVDEYIDRVSAQGYNRSSEPVRRAMDFIAQHYAEGCTLAAVARAARLSPFRIAHLVKETTGRSVMQHVRRLRVQKAEELLAQTDLSCSEIALATGFCDQSHFTRQFGGLVGMTPARYRRKKLRARAP